MIHFLINWWYSDYEKTRERNEELEIALKKLNDNISILQEDISEESKKKLNEAKKIKLEIEKEIKNNRKELGKETKKEK